MNKILKLPQLTLMVSWSYIICEFRIKEETNMETLYDCVTNIN